MSKTKEGKMIKMSSINGDDYLQMIVDAWDVQNKNRYNVFQKVLEDCENCSDPLCILACAYACHFSKVEYRKMAINYFEKYLLNPTPSTVTSFPLNVIYADIGSDCEAELDFHKAEKYYKLAITTHPNRKVDMFGQYHIFPPEIMLGRLYLKIDTQKALNYWEDLMEYPEYKNGNKARAGFRRSVDVEYQTALEKHKKGYTYRPRKKTQNKV